MTVGDLKKVKMTDFDPYFDGEVLSEVDLKEKEFHGVVREITILTLISIILYIGSFALLNLLRLVIIYLFSGPHLI